jgi:hypothetical protein
MVLTVGFSTLIYSCKDDSSSNDQTNTNDPTGIITWDDVNFTVTKGIIEEYGIIEDGIYNFDLTLFTDGVTYDGNEGEWSGKGSILYFEMYSPDSTDLANGTYTFDFNDEKPFTMSDGVALYEYIPAADSVIKEAAITAGSVVVSKSNNQYVITLDCTSQTGKKITGEYKGDLFRY